MEERRHLTLVSSTFHVFLIVLDVTVSVLSCEYVLDELIAPRCWVTEEKRQIKVCVIVFWLTDNSLANMLSILLKVGFAPCLDSITAHYRHLPLLFKVGHKQSVDTLTVVRILILNQQRQDTHPSTVSSFGSSSIVARLRFKLFEYLCVIVITPHKIKESHTVYRLLRLLRLNILLIEVIVLKGSEVERHV